MQQHLKRILLCAVICLVFNIASYADEGMWLPHLLRLLNEQDMKAAGLKLSAEDIYNINKISLKDGVVQFGNGCTGEVISNNGLLLTNHHCGYGEIQSHSTLQNNYLKEGFWAKSTAEELPCPGLTVSFVYRIEDATKMMLDGITPQMVESERMKMIARNTSITMNTFQKNYPDYKVVLKPFYYGTEYLVFLMEEFTDVRLVGAPPSGIGKFGGDTDNWMWPRHTGDFSLFRIYAGRDNNKPATYSPYNIPYKPKFHFPVNVAGVKPGDFTMVMGFPGRTQEYLTSFAVKMLVEKVNPYKIALRNERLKLMDVAMKSNPLIQIQYAEKYAGVANYWKKWQGENNGLKRLSAVRKKQKIESEFLRWVSQDQIRFAEFGRALGNIQGLYMKMEPMELAVEYQREAIFAIEAVGHANGFRSIEKAADTARARIIAQIEQSLPAYYKDHNDALDRQLFELCIRTYVKDIPESYHPASFTELRKKYKDDYKKMGDDLYSKSALSDSAKTRKLLKKLEGGKNLKPLQNDVLYQFATSFAELYETTLMPQWREYNAAVESNNRAFLAGLREMQTTRKFYPDANFTLRVAYGNVKGYHPADGVTYDFQTTLDGVMAKEDTSKEEFRIPKRLKELWEKKDYSVFAENGTIPVAFIASNHTTGGNSGSPVLDNLGNLIGLNFDRCWEGTMSDIMYDPEECRNIAMDVRYLLFIIDKYAGAGYLLTEMTLVANVPPRK